MIVRCTTRIAPRRLLRAGRYDCRAAAAAIMVVLFCVAVPLHTQAARWYEDYELAVQKIDEEGCSTQAIELLGAAVVDKKRSRLGARTYAQRRIDYLPYFHLARAHLECGNLALARSYLEDSKAQGVAPAAGLQELEGRIAAAEQQRQQNRPPALDADELASRVEQAEQRINSADEAAQRLRVAWNAAGSAEVVAADPDLGASRRSAEQKLDSARSRLASGAESKDPFAIADAGAMAAEAGTAFSALVRELDSRKQQLADERTRQQAAARRTATARARPTATPPPSGPVLIPTASGRQPSDLRSPTRPPPQVPDSLRSAAMHYFRADYQQVIETLGELSYSEDREQAAASLLLAAARFALFCQGGEEELSLAEQARADIGRLRRLAPSLEPDPEIFSPRFLTLFHQERGDQVDGDQGE